MGFFDKYFTSEEEKPEEKPETAPVRTETPVEVEKTETTTPIAPMEPMESVSQSEVIETLYQENPSEGPSIFLVNDYLGTLPSEMTDKKKLETILRIFKVSALSVPDLVADGNRRMEILKSYEDQMTESKDGVIDSAKEDIQQMKEMIEKLEQKIAKTEEEKKNLTEVLETEISRVNALVTFIKEEKS